VSFTVYEPIELAAWVKKFSNPFDKAATDGIPAQICLGWPTDPERPVPNEPLLVSSWLRFFTVCHDDLLPVTLINSDFDDGGIWINNANSLKVSVVRPGTACVFGVTADGATMLFDGDVNPLQVKAWQKLSIPAGSISIELAAA
jgi:hypothetical protein